MYPVFQGPIYVPTLVEVEFLGPPANASTEVDVPGGQPTGEKGQFAHFHERMIPRTFFAVNISGAIVT